MIDYGELAREVADTVQPSPAEDVTRTVLRRYRRRRMVRRGVAAAVALIVATPGVAYLYYDRGTDLSVPAAKGAAELPADRAVGAGIRVDPDCSGGACVPVLTTRDGQRYSLPGPRAGVFGKGVAGVGMSPNGHWVAYNRGREVEVRDLTGTTAWQVDDSWNLGTPVAWSANNRWVLIHPVKQRSVDMLASHDLIRVDLRTGDAVSVDLAQILHVDRARDGMAPLPSLLPDGDIAYPMEGTKPTGKPSSHVTPVRSGSYRIVDPETQKQVRTLPVTGATPWGVVGQPDNAGRERLVWAPDGPGMLVTDPQGARGVVRLWLVGNSTKLVLVDMAKGGGRTVDVTRPLRSAFPKDHPGWQVLRLGYDGITLAATSARGETVGTVVLDPAGTKLLSVHRIADGARGTVVPGMPNIY